MKACYLIRYGDPDRSFEWRETPVPCPGDNEVLVKVSSFGLNFADVMARKGLYRDAPPLPFVPGYEVAGTVEDAGKNAGGLRQGMKVLAFTRFGGYAEYVKTDCSAVVPVPADWDDNRITAFGTQYCTAWHAAITMAGMREGEKVLINSAAGGVGNALVQLAAWKKCRITATVGSPEKMRRQWPEGSGILCYREKDFWEKLDSCAAPDGFDIIFDSIGGSHFRKCMKRLTQTGRMTGYGAASRSKGGFFSLLRLALGFGIVHPAFLLMNSRSLIGVNMLRIADRKPGLLREAMLAVVKLGTEGVLDPLNGGVFGINELDKAHALLESGKSTGKISVKFS